MEISYLAGLRNFKNSAQNAQKTKASSLKNWSGGTIPSPDTPRWGSDTLPTSPHRRLDIRPFGARTTTIHCTSFFLIRALATGYTWHKVCGQLFTFLKFTPNFANLVAPPTDGTRNCLVH